MLEPELIPRPRRLERHERTGENHLAGLELHAVAAEGIGKPRHRGERRALYGRPQALGQGLAILPDLHLERRKIERPRIDTLAAEHEYAAGGVVGHGVDDADVPVGDARVDHLETRRDGL